MEYSKSIIEQIHNYCMEKPGVYESYPFGEDVICYKVMGKIYAQFMTTRTFYKMTLKCEPEMALMYRELYPEFVVRGYHCPPVQQPYWNTIDLDLLQDEKLLYQMIDEAYDAVLKKFTKKARRQLESNAKYEYRNVNGNHPDFKELCRELDHNLDELVGAETQRAKYNQYNTTEEVHDVLVVYHDEAPVACGGFKHYDNEHVELKRIFVRPSYRNSGLGAEIVRRLEAMAKIQGYRFCILETGEAMETACHVYQKLGYKSTERYGPYVDMPNSICMIKKI